MQQNHFYEGKNNSLVQFFHQNLFSHALFLRKIHLNQPITLRIQQAQKADAIIGQQQGISPAHQIGRSLKREEGRV